MIVFLIDADNLSSAAWIEEACGRIEAAEGRLAVRRAYGSAENLKGLSQVMQAWAIRPFVNLSLTKNTTDVALAVDAMELACQLPKPTAIAIGSGDADFLPLVVRLRERGIRMICVSERTKMASEASHAYDAVLLVGREAGRERSAGEAPAAAKKSPAKKAAVKKATVAKVADATPAKDPRTRQSPAAKSEAKAKPKPKPEVQSDARSQVQGEGKATAKPAVTVAQILQAVPALGAGQSLPLGDVVKQLHSADLIGKNTASTKLFKKFPDQFALSPERQPNQVRYILT